MEEATAVTLPDELWGYIFSFLSNEHIFQPTSLVSKRWRTLSLAQISSLCPPFSSPTFLFTSPSAVTEGEEEGEGDCWLPRLWRRWGCGSSIRTFDATNLLYIDDEF